MSIVENLPTLRIVSFLRIAAGDGARSEGLLSPILHAGATLGLGRTTAKLGPPPSALPERDQHQTPTGSAAAPPSSPLPFDTGSCRLPPADHRYTRGAI